MHKKFLSNLFFLIAINLIIKPFWIFGIDRTVQNIVGAEAYGFYFSLLNVSFLFNIFLDIGITNFNNKNISQNKQLLNKHFSGIVVLKFLLSIIYILITLIFSLIIGYNNIQIKLLLLLCFNQFLASFVLYLRSNITGLQLFKTDSLLSVLDRLLMIFICAILLWSGLIETTFKIEWFVYAQTLSYFLTMLVAFIIVIKKAHFKRIRWHFPFYLVILKKSMPFALLSLLMYFYYRTDGIMLERILVNGAFEAGIYAAAFRLLDALVMVAYLFPVILLPTFSLMLKKNENIKPLLKLSFFLITTIAISIGISSFFYKEDIIDILYHNNKNLISPVFGVLMLCFIAICGTNILSTLLTANDNLKQLSRYALLGVFINISLNFFLIPKYKALGSAYASLFTQFLILGLQLFLIKKVFNVGFNIKIVSKLLAFVIIVLFMGFLSKGIEWAWFLKYILIIFVSLLCIFLLKIIDYKEIINAFVKQKK